ncbi:MAG: diaminopimelate decarboxylase [Bulleidia sp.]
MDRLILKKAQAEELIRKYGSPLYVYDEEILRNRCREVKNLVPLKEYRPQYSAKANSNIELLKIIREEGLNVDAMSPGEVAQERAAGYEKEQIMYCSGNMSEEEMKYAHDHAGLTILDSLSQLDRYGNLFPGSEAGIRVNPGIGAGHDQKVITGGKTKFGVLPEDLNGVQEILNKHSMKLIALHEHVGSLFLDDTVFLKAAEILLGLAEQFPEVRILDFGGGLGVPYQGEERLDLKGLGRRLTDLIASSEKKTGRNYEIRIEPGRYIAAECSMLAGTVTDLKESGGVKYLGTDVGFNVLLRPVLYHAHHRIHGYSDSLEEEVYTVCGNLCESGDILSENEKMQRMQIGELIGIENAGAYGFSMSSDYNGRLRPAEVLLSGGKDRLIRKQESLEDLIHQI